MNKVIKGEKGESFETELVAFPGAVKLSDCGNTYLAFSVSSVAEQTEGGGTTLVGDLLPEGPSSSLDICVI